MVKKGANKVAGKAAPPAPAASSSSSAGRSQQETDEAAELQRQWAEQAASNTNKAKQSQAQAVWKNEQTKEWERQEAAKARDKAREEQKWQKAVEAAKARAKKESVLEAEDWGDAWWLDLGGKQWKEVGDQFHCTLCAKHLNEGNLEAHLDSAAHQRRLAWSQPTPSASSTPSAARPATASAAAGPAPKAAAAPSAPAGWGAGTALEEWQEMTEVGVRCIPCSKIIDESHLAKDDHKNRLAMWFESEQARKYGRPAPQLPYLAWVPWEASDPNGERCMKCLLCNKWVQDETSHIGSFQAPAGSKEHAKNLRNADVNGAWYKENVVALRRKWHPEAASAAPTTRTATSSAGPTLAPSAPAPWAPQPQPQAAPTPSVARWGKQAAAPQAAAPAAEPPAKSPPAKAPPAQAAPPAAAAPVELPTGWEMAIDKQTGKPYYFNRETDETSWEAPELPRSAPPPPPPASPPPAAAAANDLVDV